MRHRLKCDYGPGICALVWITVSIGVAAALFLLVAATRNAL